MVVKNKGLISVIIPLFGDFDSKRIEICVDSIKNQRGINCEIIIVEQTEIPRLEGLQDIVYRHILPSFSEDGFFIPGKVRNYAAKVANGEFIYNNDGDILFFNNGYLEKLIELLREEPKSCFNHPPMRRLPIENFEDLKNRYEKNGIDFALSSLDCSQPYGSTYPENPIRIRHFIKEINGVREVLVATQTDHEKYLGGKNKGKEPFFYTLEVHAGGTLMRKEQFEYIGGYCERYSGWGCHDVDLQWRLKHFFDLKRIPQIPFFEVLHLDHPRNYFSNERWKKNERILCERQSLGVLDIIKEDCRHYNNNNNG